MSDDVVVILGRGVRRSAAEHGAAVGLGHRVRHRVALLRGQSVNDERPSNSKRDCFLYSFGEF